MSGATPGGPGRHRAPAFLDPENLDFNKRLKFHNEETSIH